jgi:hypothetical protein
MKNKFNLKIIFLLTALYGVAICLIDKANFPTQIPLILIAYILPILITLVFKRWRGILLSIVVTPIILTLFMYFILCTTDEAKAWFVLIAYVNLAWTAPIFVLNSIPIAFSKTRNKILKT